MRGAGAGIEGRFDPAWPPPGPNHHHVEPQILCRESGMDRNKFSRGGDDSALRTPINSCNGAGEIRTSLNLNEREPPPSLDHQIKLSTSAAPTASQHLIPMQSDPNQRQLFGLQAPTVGVGAGLW